MKTAWIWRILVAVPVAVSSGLSTGEAFAEAPKETASPNVQFEFKRKAFERRLAKQSKATQTLQTVVGQPIPDDLKPEDKLEVTQYNVWLSGVVDRFEAIAIQGSMVLEEIQQRKDIGTRDVTEYTERLHTIEVEMIQAQARVRDESREYHMKSVAARARHESSMNVIRTLHG